jgi:DNA-binding response OmpR family regulator
MKVFIIEDDATWQLVYRETLGTRFNTSIFSTIEELDAALKAETNPYILLADLKLREGSFLNYLREHPTLTKLGKVLVISSTDEEGVLEECFKLGVADYLTKPINAQELMVKTKRLYELHSLKNSLGLRIDRLSNSLTYNDTEIQLTPREFQILHVLMEKREAGVPKEELLEAIWKNTSVTSNTVEVHICNIRKKLQPIGFEIITKAPQTFHLVRQTEMSAPQAGKEETVSVPG